MKSVTCADYAAVMRVSCRLVEHDCFEYVSSATLPAVNVFSEAHQCVSSVRFEYVSPVGRCLSTLKSASVTQSAQRSYFKSSPATDQNAKNRVYVMMCVLTRSQRMPIRSSASHKQSSTWNELPKARLAAFPSASCLCADEALTAN